MLLHIDTVLSKYFDEKIVGSLDEICEYSKSIGAKISKVTIHNHLDNYQSKKVYNRTKKGPSINYFYKPENEEDVLKILSAKGKVLEHDFASLVISCIENYFSKNVAGMYNDIYKSIDISGEKFSIDSLKYYLKKYGKVYVSADNIPLAYFFLPEKKEEALSILKSKGSISFIRPSLQIISIIEEYLNANHAGNCSEILDYANSKGVKVSTSTVNRYLGRYCPARINNNNCVYYYKSENKDKAFRKLKEIEKELGKNNSTKLFIDSFFSEKVIGTRLDIIKYAKSKGIKAPRTTIYDNLKEYDSVSIKVDYKKGRPITYFYNPEKKEQALALIKEIGRN